MRRARLPKSYSDFVARVRVPLGFVLAFAFLWFSTPTWRSLLWGTPVAAAGLFLRGWAAGHLRKDRVLTTSGPYGYLRNPLYTGTLLVALGLAIASAQAALALLFALFFFLVYLPAIELEEQHLEDLFGEDFRRYARVVPMILPRLRRATPRGAFAWDLYRKNREYQALAGFATGLAFLAAKALWLA
jgi:protein-S-isoprenylcysteine O-methyltransferase Ste14